MLWYKGWLETRSKILLALLFAVFPIPLMTLTQHTNTPAFHPPLTVLRGAVGFLGFYWAFIPIMLAGSGIKTQTFRAQKGLHGSMFYTLSLPVSRSQLFLTRSSLGLSELAAVLAVAPFAVLLIFPALRPYVANSDLVKYWIAIFVRGVGFYFIGAILSTLFDDLTQNWTGLFAIVILRGVLSNAHVPAPLDIFRPMGEGSPLFTHSLPWAQMGVAIACAAICCSAALMAVKTREY